MRQAIVCKSITNATNWTAAAGSAILISLRFYMASSMTTMSLERLNKLYPYRPPNFARHFKNVPKYRLKLANLPTPLQRICSPKDNNDCDGNSINNTSYSNNKNGILQTLRDLNIELIFKRDDMTGGTELGGNKVRKLEFLLADALHKEYDSVVTIGGEQSNHCRATATACRMVGLDPHLILRTRRADEVEKSKKEKEDSFGYVGNILFDRLVGATIHTCTPGEYGRVGSQTLTLKLCEDLERQQQQQQHQQERRKRVYPIPVGGSNGLGTWGYIEAVDELMNQIQSDDESSKTIDHFVFASGSGGTAAGICMGLTLALAAYQESSKPTIHAIGVCDDPNYFYNTISNITKEMGLDEQVLASLSSSCTNSTTTTITTVEDLIRDRLIVHQGKGKGYAVNTSEELDFIVQFAIETGISLDPVYSGKALYRFMDEIKKDPSKYRNSRILFWHTGGSLGNFDKVEELRSKIRSISSVNRINVYNRKDT